MGKLRWKREPRETGLAAVCAGPRGYRYHDGEDTYAIVYPFNSGYGNKIGGWYWVTGWDGGVPHKNTCNSPCKTPEEAKKQAEEYVKKHLK